MISLLPVDFSPFSLTSGQAPSAFLLREPLDRGLYFSHSEYNVSLGSDFKQINPKSTVSLLSFKYILLNCMLFQHANTSVLSNCVIICLQQKHNYFLISI